MDANIDYPETDWNLQDNLDHKDLLRQEQTLETTWKMDYEIKE